MMRELDEIFRYCASDGFQWVSGLLSALLWTLPYDSSRMLPSTSLVCHCFRVLGAGGAASKVGVDTGFLLSGNRRDGFQCSGSDVCIPRSGYGADRGLGLHIK